jgi:hypothetical protein
MIFEKIPKMVSIRGSEMAIFVKKEPLTHKTHTPPPQRKRAQISNQSNN